MKVIEDKSLAFLNDLSSTSWGAPPAHLRMVLDTAWNELNKQEEHVNFKEGDIVRVELLGEVSSADGEVAYVKIKGYGPARYFRNEHLTLIAPKEPPVGSAIHYKGNLYVRQSLGWHFISMRDGFDSYPRTWESFKDSSDIRLLVPEDREETEPPF